jgi:uncharacterized membrane protein YecN with MAPEG domain
MNFFEQFQQLALPVGVIALLMHMQVLVLDVLGLRAKHLPGTPVEANHGSPIFRASRTVANTNETIAVFILALMFCVLAQATPFTPSMLLGVLLFLGFYMQFATTLILSCLGLWCLGFHCCFSLLCL